MCLECAHFTKYKYSFPFSHKKLMNTGPRGIEQSLQFADKLYRLTEVCKITELPCSSTVPCLGVTLQCKAFYLSNIQCGCMAEVAILVWHHRHRCCRRRRLWAIPLAVLTMKNETLGFHNFYLWSSYVSQISFGMGLRSPKLWASKTLLKSEVSTRFL